MSTRFTQKNVEDFLLENGTEEALANKISNYVVVAVRTTSIGADIVSQNVNEDSTAYNAELLAGDATKLSIAYTDTKRGAGFHEHAVSVTHGEQTYGLSNLVFSPLDLDLTKAVAVVEEVKELAEDVAEDVAEFVEEVQEIFVEPEVVEPEVEVTPEADPEPEVVVVVEPEVEAEVEAETKVEDEEKTEVVEPEAEEVPAAASKAKKKKTK
jgi:hypothetical protein